MFFVLIQQSFQPLLLWMGGGQVKQICIYYSLNITQNLFLRCFMKCIMTSHKPSSDDNFYFELFKIILLEEWHHNLTNQPLLYKRYITHWKSR